MKDSWYERHGAKPPEHILHDVTPDDLPKKMRRLKATNWRQEGNKLIADTEMGPLINFLPTDVILDGVDNEGLPKFRKLDIS
jgi:hypothetical protein